MTGIPIDKVASRAVDAAVATATALGLDVEHTTVLHASNRITVRLAPCDVLARVAPVADRAGAAFEVEIAGLLAGTGGPVGVPEPRVRPRVYVRAGFAVTLWRYHEPVPGELAPAAYADALVRLHAGLRRVDLPLPHVTDRVGQARQLVEDRRRSPDLGDADRALLRDTLTNLGGALVHGAAEQPLHGEPHPGNVLATGNGPLFVDFESCCRGPVEFDLAHAPEPVGAHYPAADPDLLGRCRILTLAIATAWRWDRADRFPDGRRLGLLWLDQLRAATGY